MNQPIRLLSTILLLLLFSNLAHSMYDPVQGRWCSRDPIGELGGENLYAICENNPTKSNDYLGLLVTITTDLQDPTGVIPTPGPTKNPKHIAETDVDAEVNCTCQCVSQNSDGTKWYSINCTIKTTAAITLNPNNKPVGVGKDGKPFPNKKSQDIGWEQIYGHEQRHVVSRNKLVEKAIEPFNDHGAGDSWNSQKVCEQSIPDRTSDLKKAVAAATADDTGGNHRDGGGLHNDDSPYDRIGYPPLPGSPGSPGGPAFPNMNPTVNKQP